jgi:hypothetical protein
VRVFLAWLGKERAMAHKDDTFTLITIGVGLAGIIALWCLGMLLANGFVWPN